MFQVFSYVAPLAIELDGNRFNKDYPPHHSPLLVFEQQGGRVRLRSTYKKAISFKTCVDKDNEIFFYLEKGKTNYDPLIFVASPLAIMYFRDTGRVRGDQQGLQRRAPRSRAEILRVGGQVQSQVGGGDVREGSLESGGDGGRDMQAVKVHRRSLSR